MRFAIVIKKKNTYNTLLQSNDFVEMFLCGLAPSSETMRICESINERQMFKRVLRGTKCLSQAIIAIPLHVFDEMKSMCYFQERLLSNKFPRYFSYILRSRDTLWLELLSNFLYDLRSPIYVCNHSQNFTNSSLMTV